MTKREKVPQKPPCIDEIEVEIDFRILSQCDPWSLDRVGGISGNGTVVLECDRVIGYKAFSVPWPSDRELEGVSLSQKRDINSAPLLLNSQETTLCTE